MIRSTVTVAGGVLKSATVKFKKNSESIGAVIVSIPQPEIPFRKDSCPGQLNIMHEDGAHDRMRKDRSPSS